MMYDDDYLWDRSGPPDPEIQELENKLQRLRYRPRELRLPRFSRALNSRALVSKMMAAAALMFLFMAPIYLWHKNAPARRSDSERDAKVQANNSQAPKNESQTTDDHGAPGGGHSGRLQPNRRPPAHPVEARVPPSRNIGLESPVEIAFEIPSPEPATTRFSSHIEMTQLLLRSFRNSAATISGDCPEVVYDKRQSRELLYQNIALRKAASTSGDLPTEELLGSLEPILLDIANLPEKPSSQEVRSIRDRIQKEEIVATLQAYAVPVNSRF